MRLSEDIQIEGISGDDFVFTALVADSVIVSGADADAGAGGGLGIDSISCHS